MTGMSRTAFQVCCMNGYEPCATVLLKDPRVDVQMGDDLWSPLVSAAASGHAGIIRKWIASRRPLSLGQPGHKSTDAIAAARRSKDTATLELLTRFKKNPAQTAHEVRAGFRLRDALAPQLFAILVLFCDDFLQLKKPGTNTRAVPNTKSRRFFNIARQLPMELQMVLCNRVYHIPKSVVSLADSDVAFKSVVKYHFG